MTTFTESDVEEAALAWLENTGWRDGGVPNRQRGDPQCIGTSN